MRAISEILKSAGFRPDKRLGQNFLTDPSLLERIVRDSGVGKEDTVLEIGAGAGTLTRALSAAAGKVLAFEIDERLRPALDETLRGLDNVSVMFGDVMRIPDAELASAAGGSYKVVANIPYYLSSPVITRFLESDFPPSSMTLTVQREVAERLAAAPGTPEYGAITVAAAMCGEVRITGYLDRRMFRPIPNVDSAVVRVDLDGRYAEENRKLMKKLVRCAFGARRKTFVNNLSACFGMSKETAAELLRENDLDERARGEVFSVEDFARLSRSPVFG